MKIVLGADHAGIYLKNVIGDFLISKGHEIIDAGSHRSDPADDYPDIVRTVALTIIGGKALRGIVICGSGVGASVAGSKFPGIRAAVCHDSYSAHQGVEHDDINILCLGSRVIGEELAKEISSIYSMSEFSGEERHIRRLGKIKDIEKEFMKAES